MFSTDAMDYGAFPMDFPVPEDFCWVYPTRCGYNAVRPRAAAAVSSDPTALLVYILSGSGTAVCGGQECAYGADCVIMAESAPQLTLRAQEQTEYLYLLLHNAEALVGRIGFVRQLDGDSRADRLLGRICYNARTKQPGSVYAASADVFALFMEICERCEAQGGEYSPLVRQAIELIREDYAFLTGVDELADRLGVTKSHFIRSFTAAAGTSPGKYLQAVKLDNAKLMLQNRDYSIEMIADMAGYSGANYFCKVFRRVTGESPGEYRARHLAPPALDLENKRKLEELEGIYHV